MSVLLQIGLIDVTVGLLACTATSAIGVAMFVRAGRVVPAPEVRTALAPAIAAAKASVPAA
jgi:hypothetical protein